MGTANRWVDETWWRDWLFWVAGALATANLVYNVVNGDAAWWYHIWRWGYSFVICLAVTGFVRTVVRSFRSSEESTS